MVKFVSDAGFAHRVVLIHYFTMRLILTLLFLPVWVAFTGEGKTPGQDVPEGKPSIQFAETEHDFGIVETGKEASYCFVFVNKGKVPLVISNVRSSCGCTVPQWPRIPITGGGRDSIRVEYNTKIKGAFNKTITVHSNAQEAVVELRIKGNVAKTK